MSTGAKAAVAGALVFAVAGANHAVAGAAHHHAPGRVPRGGYYTPVSWARALLHADGQPVTRCNVAAVAGWEAAEGGHWANGARFNPLDTTQPAAGSHPMNPVGVQAYPSWRTGFAATLQTLHNGNYPGILAALSAGDSAQAVANAVAGSPWGTGPFTASC